MRTCERCGEGMAPGRPRVRVGGKQLWCQTCVKTNDSPSGRYRPGTDIAKAADLNPHERMLEGIDPIDPGKGIPTGAKPDLTPEYDPDHPRDKRSATERLLEASMNTKLTLTATLTGQRIVVVAHDSGDGQTIYHCPFCGSGQVIARSDRTIECEFCHTSFTVQVQPEYSAFPQTDPQTGLPIQVPGMPGQIDNPVGAQPDPAMDPNADTDQDGVPDAQDPDANGDGFNDAQPAGASNQPPWLKGARLYHTASGQALAPADYVRHLAIKHADDRSAVLMQVRATRSAR